MTRTGTRRRDRVYSYYSCAGCQQKGKSVCKGRHIPIARLDTLVLDNVKERLLQPERMASILQELVQRVGAKKSTVDERRSRLLAELADKKERLGRLYRAIEEGIAELDDDLKARIAALKQERDIVQTSLDRIREQATAKFQITPERIAAFSAMVGTKLDSGDVQARRAYLRSIISCIEVGDEKIRIIGDRSVLADAVSGRNTPEGSVRPFVRKWRARQDSNLRPQA